MPAQMRRFVHRALENNELVETVSEGEGKWRKVVIKERVTPVGQKPADEKAKDAAAKSPAKCVIGSLDKETASAEVKLDNIIAGEKAAKKAEIAAAAACPVSPEAPENGPACVVSVKQEEEILKNAPESEKECKLEEQTAEQLRK